MTLFSLSIDFGYGLGRPISVALETSYTFWTDLGHLKASSGAGQRVELRHAGRLRVEAQEQPVLRVPSDGAARLQTKVCAQPASLL